MKRRRRRRVRRRIRGWGLRRRRRRPRRHVRHDAAPPDAAAHGPPHVRGRLHICHQREGEAAHGPLHNGCCHSRGRLTASGDSHVTAIIQKGRQRTSSTTLRERRQILARCIPVLARIELVPPARCTLDLAKVPCTLRHVFGHRQFDPLELVPCHVLCSGRLMRAVLLRCDRSRQTFHRPCG